MKNNILLIGMPGCGKSTIGKMLADNLGFDFIDADEFLVNKFEKSIDSFFENGEEYFREAESECCEILAKMENVVVASGGGIVKKASNMECFQNWEIVFINRPLDMIMDDIETDKRPLLKEGKEKLIKIYDERMSLYKKYATLEISNVDTIDNVVKFFDNYGEG